MATQDGAAMEMKEVVAILAMPGKDVLAQIPAGSHRVEKLALRFDEVYTVFVGSLVSLPTEAQLVSLQEIDSELQAMSDPELASLWTDSAVVEHPQWEHLRELARRALRQFEW
jgi:hypothetical protein